MRIPLLLAMVISLSSVTGVVAFTHLRQDAAPPAQDVTRTLPTVADQAAATGAPLRLEAAAMRLPVDESTEYAIPMASSGSRVVMCCPSRSGQGTTSELTLVLWDLDSNQRRVIDRWHFNDDYNEEVIGFDGDWLLLKRRERNKDVALTDLLLVNIESGAQRRIASFDADVELPGVTRSANELKLSDGRVLWTEGMLDGTGTVRQRIRLYTIRRDRWETLLERTTPSVGELLFGVKMLGSDKLAWFETGEGNRPSALVITDRKSGGRTWFKAPADRKFWPAALTADGRYLLWNAGAPDTPIGKDTFLGSEPHIFATDLQSMATVDLGEAPHPTDQGGIGTNKRFAAMAAGFLQDDEANDEAAWGFLYDTHTSELRSLVGHAFDGYASAGLLGDWLMVSEVNHSDQRRSSSWIRLHFFRLPH